MDGFRYDAHPMSMLASTVAALSAFYPEAKNIKDADDRRIQKIRMIAKMPTIAAFSYRHSMGLPYVYPNNDLSFVGNFLAMIKKIGTDTYKVNPVLEHALDVLFILHADHEQNCSTTAVRLVGSSQVDPFSAVAAGITALYGPLHGGANEAVLRMLRGIGHVSKVPEFIKQVKERRRRDPADGLRPPRLQELRPAGEGHQARRRRGVRGDGQEPAARHRPRAGADRARRTTTS